MGLWTPLRPTTAGSLGLFSSFWSVPRTVPSLYLPFPLSPIFSSISCHFHLLILPPTPFPLSLSLPRYFLVLSPIYLLPPLWFCEFYCLPLFFIISIFPKFFPLFLINFTPLFPILSPILPSLLNPFLLHFPLHFVAHCFSFLPILPPSFSLEPFLACSWALCCSYSSNMRI